MASQASPVQSKAPESGGWTSWPVVSTVLDALSTFDIDNVTTLLEQAAYFNLFASLHPGPGTAREELQLEQPARRFRILVEPHAGGPLQAFNDFGRVAATVKTRWQIIPDDHQGDPRKPPVRPLALDPRKSQRFELRDLEVRFGDDDESGLRAYGTGRTYPTAGPELQVGAVAEILEGFGRLAGRIGTVVLNGALVPGERLDLQLLIRMMDPESSLLTPAGFPFLNLTDPEPGVTYVGFRGEVDAQHPVTLRISPSGQILGSNVFEQLRGVDLDWGIEPPRGLVSRLQTGPVVGSVSAQLSFNPLALPPLTPVQTSHGVFTFHDACGRVRGTIEANMTEGRSFRTSLRGALLPVFRFGGFGPILGGTGDFAGITGMMSMNSAISVFPRTLSNFYVLRAPARLFEGGRANA
jgi:hypothetical protein